MKNILQYLESAVGRFPNGVCVSMGERQLTFGGLYALARRVGSFLLHRGPGGTVGVLMDRGPEMAAAMLGIAYAGAAWSVLDPRQPGERLLGILSRLGSPGVLCDEAGAGLLKGLGYSGPILPWSQAAQSSLEERALSRVRRDQTDMDPLYIVFTSGSTGQPKGVVGCHRAVIDYTEGLCLCMPFDEKTVFGNQSPWYFDAYLKELMPALKLGARVELIPSALFRLPGSLMDYIQSSGINTLCWVASALSLVAGLGGLQDRDLKQLHLIAFASEVLPQKALSRWRQACPEARFFNLYGPTEATGICCYYEVEGEPETIPIGRPFPNTGIGLLDGEICIWGSRLTLGYLGEDQGGFCQRPGLGGRMYRTGDLGRYNDRGELEFLGRRDSQVKLMGHRVELGEIEAAALAAEGVREAACICREGAVILFYAGEAEKGPLARELRLSLPDYMRPRSLQKLEALPRLPNGKVDRKALG